MNETQTQSYNHHIYENTMECLVKEEIEKQLKNYPKTVIKFINKTEIEAYALNRLPALYASSEQGREKQKEIGQQKYQKQISLAVSQALVTVRENPYTESKSIASLSGIEVKYQEARQALQKLQIFLTHTQLLNNSSQEITWDNLVSVVHQALNKLYWKQENPNLELPNHLKEDTVNPDWNSHYLY
ncbi:hypothetical protein PCC7424_1530 [Gloeothece citriformis PCC 7424]|uniref:Late competence development protein ComFB n=1 Tax=Gloeothece citriformis (strain PCC 7424) TaxID=65393 RepID=B7K9K2_GLOC7|nr:late competence development ComFB family protein [Gloeothece citriformis]ACK69970.1 hypothetical protein PCC7424_1530 [Gloeothece citriformis PCC 7424]